MLGNFATEPAQVRQRVQGRGNAVHSDALEALQRALQSAYEQLGLSTDAAVDIELTLVVQPGK